MRIVADPLQPGQESVWTYPRPAVAEACARRIRIVHRAMVVADSTRTVRTLETSHPPTYYIPRADMAEGVLLASRRRSVCEWKGEAVYFDVAIDGEVLLDVAWAYPAPSPAFMSLRDHVAFYTAPFDGCFVDGERVVPQPGNFYGGWISPQVAGPFKGVPGSMGW